MNCPLCNRNLKQLSKNRKYLQFTCKCEDPNYNGRFYEDKEEYEKYNFNYMENDRGEVVDLTICCTAPNGKDVVLNYGPKSWQIASGYKTIAEGTNYLNVSEAYHLLQRYLKLLVFL